MQRRIEPIIDRYASRLRHLALILLGQADEAEDVVQEALIKLWTHDRKVIVGSELPWLLTCTRNACLDRLRSRSRTQNLRLQLVDELKAQSQGAHTAGPEEITDQTRRQRILLDALSELPEPGRSLLILRDLQELDIATTAQTLELSKTQVKVYTFRARRVLRRRIKEELHEQVA